MIDSNQLTVIKQKLGNNCESNQTVAILMLDMKYSKAAVVA